MKWLRVRILMYIMETIAGEKNNNNNKKECYMQVLKKNPQINAFFKRIEIKYYVFSTLLLSF